MLEGSVAEHLRETENLPHPFVMSTKRKMIQEDSDYM